MGVFLRKLCVALTPKSWLLKTTLSNGAIVYGKNRAGFGGRGIYIFRDGLEPELAHLEQLLPVGGVLIDVGANTGVYSLKAAKHVGPAGTVVAVEPFPDVLATLLHSVQANGFANVRLRNFCAGEKTAAATLWLNTGHPNMFSLVQRDARAACLSTLTVALDDLFAWEGLSRLDYLKIDAEGAEQQVLAGARTILARFRPIIQVEILLGEAALNLPDYHVFAAPGSPNKIYIPLESHAAALPEQWGWARL